MSARRVGSAFWRRGRICVQISLRKDDPANPKRRAQYGWVCPERLDGKPVDMAYAKDFARIAQRSYDDGAWNPLAPKDAGATETTIDGAETVESWSARWLAERSARGLASVRSDRGRMRKHVLRRWGHLPMAGITRAHLEDFVASLDDEVRAGSLAWKSAVNIWSIVTTMFDDACTAKARALRVLTADPTVDVRPPDRGVRKAKQYLLPREFMALWSCEAVHLARRELYAVAVYTYLRAGELHALEWPDADLEQGVLRVTRAVNYDTGDVRAPKTEAGIRALPIEPALLPLLQRMRSRRSGTRVFDDSLFALDLAKALRKDLRAAGVIREGLFLSDRTRKPITFHDLRATGITWLAMRGDDLARIMRRAGHSAMSTTLGYIREAESLGNAAAGVFPELVAPGEPVPAF